MLPFNAIVHLVITLVLLTKLLNVSLSLLHSKRNLTENCKTFCNILLISIQPMMWRDWCCWRIQLY